VGNDLRAGKHTALVAEARSTLSDTDTAVLDAVLGNALASAQAVAHATAVLRDSGVRERLEARLMALLSETRAALESAPLGAEGKAMLNHLADRLVLRQS
jgi:geranylgeranyl diphosphate synthase type I